MYLAAPTTTHLWVLLQLPWTSIQRFLYWALGTAFPCWRSPAELAFPSLKVQEEETDCSTKRTAAVGEPSGQTLSPQNHKVKGELLLGGLPLSSSLLSWPSPLMSTNCNDQFDWGITCIVLKEIFL